MGLCYQKDRAARKVGSFRPALTATELESGLGYHSIYSNLARRFDGLSWWRSRHYLRGSHAASRPDLSARPVRAFVARTCTAEVEHAEADF
jgi:hypothetical protein